MKGRIYHMKCPSCGAEVTGRFCSYCGAPLPAASDANLSAANNTDDDRLVDDWKSFDDYVNRKSTAPLLPETPVPADLLPVQPGLLQDVGKKTERSKPPIPADIKMLPQTSIPFIKPLHKRQKPSTRRRKREVDCCLRQLP